jgi:uncharacterized membrane protein (DUF485 family)
MASAPWRPRRATVLFIGALTAWPIVYFFLFIGFIAFSFASINGGAGGHPNAGFNAFRYIVPAHILTMLLMFVLTAVYVVPRRACFSHRSSR